MSTALQDLIAKRFIARPDVKAIQFSNGSWSPHRERDEQGKMTGPFIPWGRSELAAHLEGSRTYGHYLLNHDDKVKLFAFDIDLEKNEPDVPGGHMGAWVDDNGLVHPFDAREAWSDRSHPSRTWCKYQLKMVAHRLLSVITDELELPGAVAYSGGKGVHVYAFTGLISAADARDGAAIVLDTVGGWAPHRGDNFFRSVDRSPITGYPNLSIEVFPKQSTLKDKELGNLMRLPLGRNLKSTDPTFFVDMTSPMAVMRPVDPIHALTASPWKN